MPDPATHLLPGRLYRIQTAFTDQDGFIHPAGETWRFEREVFSAPENCLTLFIEQDGRKLSFRLDAREPLVAHLADLLPPLPEDEPGAPAGFDASSLLPGRSYRVRVAFSDYDQTHFPAGDTWRFLRKSFLPQEDGLTLFIERNGQPASIRLQWRPETQAALIETFSNHVELLPAADQPPAPSKPAHSKRNTATWLVIPVVVGLLIGLLVCLLGGVYIYLSITTHRPSPNVTLTPPPYNILVLPSIDANMGTEFPLEVVFENNDTRPHSLYSLALPASYLQGAAVLDSIPAFTGTSRQTSFPDSTVYAYGVQIPVGSKLDLKMRLNPLQSGTFMGDATVCIDDAAHCTRQGVVTYIH